MDEIEDNEEEVIEKRRTKTKLSGSSMKSKRKLN
jgi:hypothetical protein